MVFLLGLPLFSGCMQGSGHEQQGKGILLATRHNALYGIDVAFFGSFAGPDNLPESVHLIERIEVINLKTGARVEYHPKDPETLANTFGYFEDVWSPDSNFLVLPLGRFEGFAVFPADRALTLMQSRQSGGTIQIRMAGKDSPLLWHEFLGWAGEHTLRFSAGLSGSGVEFEYDLQNTRLNAVSGQFGSLRALTGHGPISISGHLE